MKSPALTGLIFFNIVYNLNWLKYSAFHSSQYSENLNINSIKPTVSYLNSKDSKLPT